MVLIISSHEIIRFLHEASYGKCLTPCSVHDTSGPFSNIRQALQAIVTAGSNHRWIFVGAKGT